MMMTAVLILLWSQSYANMSTW